MGQIQDDANQAFRDYVTDGDSGSGAHEPLKSDIRAVFALVDSLVGDAGVRFTFDTSTTTTADPGAGDIRLNHATLASVTEVGISDSSAASGNPDVSAWLATFDDGTSTIKGHILVRKVGAAQNFAIYAVTAATDATTHWRFTVTHVDSAGSFSASDRIAALFVPKGDKGDTGSSGGLTKATDAQVRSAAAGNEYIAPELIESASALVALTDGANIALDWDAGINRSVTLAGNRTLDNPTNGQPGTWRTIIVTQDGIGSRTLAFGANYKFAGGTAPTLSTAASAQDVLSIFCQAADRFLVFSALDLK